MKQVFKKLIFSVMCLATVAFCVQCSTDSGEYVDLGLPSGTKWKTTNETNPDDEYNFYTYDEAVEKFDEQLPTLEQLNELITKCTWKWNKTKKGYTVVGRNGNSIFMPVAGFRNCDGYVKYVGSYGNYWSDTPDGSCGAFNLYFNSGEVDVKCYVSRCIGQSVRLVQD